MNAFLCVLLNRHHDHIAPCNLPTSLSSESVLSDVPGGKAVAPGEAPPTTESKTKTAHLEVMLQQFSCHPSYTQINVQHVSSKMPIQSFNISAQ